MNVPYLDVAHLPSSASFFASVLQPLGWHLTAPKRYPDLQLAGSEIPGFVEFGIDGVPVLRVRQHNDSDNPLLLTDLSIAAPSRVSVIAFHQAGLRANPALYLTAPVAEPGAARNTTSYSNSKGTCRAMLHDLDGNRMEAVYPDPHPAGGNVKYSGSAVRETQSTQSEVGRILHWNYDVASSSPRTSAGSPMSRRHQGGLTPLRRSLTHGSQPLSTESSRVDTTPASRQSDNNNGGMNTTTVVGALLGAAAGAGLLYSAWNSREKTRDPSHNSPSAPVLTRRSTLPDMPMGVNSRVHQLDQKSGIEDLAHREYIYAGNSRKSSRENAGSRDLYADPWSKPRSVINPWTQDVPNSRGSPTRSTPPRTRAIDDNLDGRSRHSTRYNGGRTSEVRTRSAGPSARESAVERDERSSRPGSRRGSTTARSRSRTHDTDRESYTSARTHRTASTSRPPLSRPPPADYETVLRSRTASKSSGIRTPKASPHEYFGRPSPNSYVSARNVPLPMSEVSAHHVPLPASEVSARHVPLPMSGVGSSHANWDDDLDSVVPDDSISCVGSKSSRRSRRH